LLLPPPLPLLLLLHFFAGADVTYVRAQLLK
jgi:hypothetical protein